MKKTILILSFVMVLLISSVVASANDHLWNAEDQTGVSCSGVTGGGTEVSRRAWIQNTYINASSSIIRILFKDTGSTVTYRNASICEKDPVTAWDCDDSTWTQLTFNGGDLSTGPHTGDIYTDNLTYSLNSSKDYYVTALFVNDSRCQYNGGSTNAMYKVDGVSMDIKDWSGVGISSNALMSVTLIQETKTGSSSPVITLSYPVDTTYYNDYSGYINFTTDINSTCILNNSIFGSDLGNETTHYFYNGTMEDDFYSIEINCSNDLDGQSSSETFSFTVDTINPTINTNLEGNNTYHTYTQNLLINLSDSNLVNYSITGSCNTSFSNASVTDPVYFNETFNIFNCSYGEQNTTIKTCDLAGNCQLESFSWANMIRLNISAFDIYYNQSIQNFTINLSGVYVGNSTNYSFYLDNLTSGVHNITVDSFGYELKSVLIDVSDPYEAYEFQLYTTNSLRITVRDENTGLLINNVSLAISGVVFSQEYNTTTGQFFIENLTVETLTLIFTADDYNIRNYLVTISNRSSQSLDVYLISTETETIFTFRDLDSAVLLEDVLVGMYRVINESWTLVTSKLSDITGRTKFIYYPDVNYKFILTKDNYNTLSFDLTPILFSSYDIRMEQIYTVNETEIYDLVSVDFTPTIFYNGENIFYMVVLSPLGELIEYGFNLTYTGGKVTRTGTNAIGENMVEYYNITGATIFDTMTLDYYYISSIGGKKTFTYSYPIQVNTTEEGLMANMGTYGLGLFERVLIITIIMLLIMGLTALMGQSLAGLVIVFITLSYFIYVGFIEWWLFAIPLLLGAIILLTSNK